MPSQEAVNTSPEPEAQLFEAIAAKNLAKVREVYQKHPKINLNCMDKDELTPLQHACHTGNYELAKFLLDRGACVNFTRRKDGYTALMFAAISSRADIVRLLLEHEVDISVENCVNRTAAQMAAFVGQTKIVSIINSWIPFESSVKPYTKRRELENAPRIPDPQLATLLHSYIVYPSLHPIKLLLFIKEKPDIVKHAPEILFVLESLSSKSLRPPQNDETLSMKYYYLSYLVQYCRKAYDAKFPCNLNNNGNMSFDYTASDKCLETICKRLIRRDLSEDSDSGCSTKQIEQLILDCILKYPYTQLDIFKTMTFALARDVSGLTALNILTQTLNAPRVFAQSGEACTVCGEVDKNKKCSNCKSVYYCGPGCQKIDWFQHKKSCRSQAEAPLVKNREGDD